MIRGAGLLKRDVQQHVQCLKMHAIMDALDTQIRELVLHVEALQATAQTTSAERAIGDAASLTLLRVADVLAAFYVGPLSISSVQPLLALAEELNPSLKGR